MNYLINAEVHKPLTNGYRLKVTVESLGFYMNGFRVLPGRGQHKWWVIPPQVKIGNAYFEPIEFDKSFDLWVDIQNACIEAVENYTSDNSFTEISKEEHDKFMSEEIDKKFKEIDEFDSKQANKASHYDN